MGYDAQKHSKARLGAVGLVPALPMMPIAAQVSQATGMVHLRLMGDSYVRCSLPSIHPASYPAIVTAIRGCPTEPSYSGSPSVYYVIGVEPTAGGHYAILKAGAVTIGRVAVFPEADIVGQDDLDEAMKQASKPPALSSQGPAQGAQGAQGEPAQPVQDPPKPDLSAAADLDGKFGALFDDGEGDGEPAENTIKIWTECKGEYLPLGAGKITDVYEGVVGEDRYTFTCGHCGETHSNAQALKS